MAFVKVAKQVRLTTTVATSIWTPAGSSVAVLRDGKIANTSGSAVDVTVYKDIDGAVYDDSSTIFPLQSLGAGSAIVLSDEYDVIPNAGNYAVKAGTANAITVTLSGFEE